MTCVCFFLNLSKLSILIHSQKFLFLMDLSEISQQTNSNCIQFLFYSILNLSGIFVKKTNNDKVLKVPKSLKLTSERALKISKDFL